MRRLILLIQGLVTATLLAYAIYRVGFQNIKQSVSEVSLGSLIAAASLLLVQFPLAGWRWQFIVRFMGGHMTLRDSTRMVWAGAFYSQILPSSIGGDAIRVWMAWCSGITASRAAASVALDRIVMFITLALMVLVGSPLLSEWAGVEFSWWAAALMLFVLVSLGALFFAKSVFLRGARARFTQLIATVIEDLRGALKNPPLIGMLFLLSLFSIVNLVLVAWISCIAVNASISLAVCFIVFPAVFLFSSLPISIGGWGVREGLVVVLLSANEVPPALALSASLSFGVISALMALPGAFGASLLAQRARFWQPPSGTR